MFYYFPFVESRVLSFDTGGGTVIDNATIIFPQTIYAIMLKYYSCG